MRKLGRIATVLLLASASAARSQSGDAEWSQFRGPNGRGIAVGEASLPDRLDVEANLLWKTKVPPGHSSPCVSGDRIFVTGATDRDLRTLAVDRRTGEILWEEKALTDHFESRHRINSPATPTAATDGERVYVYFGSAGLICYDVEGTEVWMRRMRIPENRFGSAASPTLAGGKLVLLSDTAEQSFLEVLEPTTGETVWRKEREGFGAGWSTPLHWKNGDVDELVVYGTNWITAYALADGDERWSMPGVTDEPCTTPATGDGLVFVTSYNMRTNPEVIGIPPFDSLLEQYDEDGDGRLTFREVRANESILSRSDADGEGDHPLPGFFRFLDEDKDERLTVDEWDKMYAFLDQFQFANGLLAVRPGDGERETEVVWQVARGVPECPSPLFYDGRVYMVKNGGLATCVDASSGDVRFQGRLDAGGPYYASPVAGDGKIYAASARGTMTVFRAGDALEVLSHSDFDERIMATPALVDGVVYVRAEETLYAFGPLPAKRRDEPTGAPK